VAVSTVPAAKQKILDLLAANGDLAGVTITWAAPTNDSDYQEDNIWLGDVDQEEEFKVLGAYKIDETYTIPVHIQAVKQGDVEKDAEVRFWALREEVISSIRSNLTLDGVLNQWAGTFPTRVEVRPTPNGWLARGEVSLTCRARI
jgi:hypothetical protein